MSFNLKVLYKKCKSKIKSLFRKVKKIEREEKNKEKIVKEMSNKSR